jgi:hypothetical protein
VITVVTLPDVQFLQHTAVRGGDLALLDLTDDDADTLVRVGRDGVRATPLGPSDSRCWPSLLAHPAGGVVVLRDLEHAVHVAGPDQPVTPLAIADAELLDRVQPIPQGGSAVSDRPLWRVVLSHGSLMADLRCAAPLSVDLDSATARWESAPWSLDVTAFPRDLAGGTLTHACPSPRHSCGTTLRTRARRVP